jgi:hypothetical protein
MDQKTGFIHTIVSMGKVDSREPGPRRKRLQFTTHHATVQPSEQAEPLILPVQRRNYKLLVQRE